MAGCAQDTAGTRVPSSPLAVPALADGGQWTRVASSAAQSTTYDLVSEDLIVSRVNDDRGRTLVVAQTLTGRSDMVIDSDHSAGPVTMVDGVAFFVVSPHATGDTQVVAWDPVTDEDVVLAPRASGDAVAVVDGTLVYSAPDGSCLRAVDVTAPLTPADDREVWCSGDGTSVSVLGSEGSTVWAMVAGADAEQACGSVMVGTAPFTEFTAVPLAGCADRAAASATGVAWTVSPTSGDFEDPRHVALAVSTGAEQVELGKAVAGSPAWCGGALYWLTAESDVDGNQEEIRRWTDGGSVETVYSSPVADLAPGDAYSASPPRCDGDAQVWFTRSSAAAGGELIATPGLSWTPAA